MAPETRWPIMRKTSFVLPLLILIVSTSGCVQFEIASTQSSHERLEVRTEEFLAAFSAVLVCGQVLSPAMSAVEG